MLQQFKLRLSDGTVLQVDLQGLETWLVDAGALVQAPGSKKWYRLRAFLAAHAKAAARAAAARRSAARAAASAPAPAAASPDPSPADSSPPGDASIGEPPGLVVLADDVARPAAPRVKVGSRPDDPLPKIRLKPLEAAGDFAGEAASRALASPASSSPAAPVPPAPIPSAALAPASVDVPLPEPPPIGEPPGLVALADDVAPPTAARVEAGWRPDDPVPVIPLEALDGAGDSARAAASHAPAPAAEPAPVPPAPPASAPLEVYSAGHAPVGEPPGLVVLADEVARPAAGRVEVGWRPDDPLPIIPLKPLQDAADAHRAAVGRVAVDGERGTLRDSPPRALGDETLVGALTRLATHLAPWLERLDRLIQRSRRRERVSSGKPLLARRLQAFGTALGRVGTAFVGLLPQSHSPAPALLGSPGEGEGHPPVRLAPAPIESLPPPPPIEEVAVLPLARVEEPEEPETLYEEEPLWRRGWMWARRIVLVGCVVGGLALAMATWRTWVPRVLVLSRALFAEIDARARAREEGARRSQALREAREQLPHLAPATLQLVVSASPASALEPPELFRFACDAADRGLPKLPATQARELRDLRQMLLEALGPADRERVRKYDQARNHRATLPFEDRDALGSFARGARALPPASRARLQSLWGEAVAAGLENLPGASPRP